MSDDLNQESIIQISILAGFLAVTSAIIACHSCYRSANNRRRVGIAQDPGRRLSREELEQRLRDAEQQNENLIRQIGLQNPDNPVPPPYEEAAALPPIAILPPLRRRADTPEHDVESLPSSTASLPAYEDDEARRHPLGEGLNGQYRAAIDLHRDL